MPSGEIGLEFPVWFQGSASIRVHFAANKLQRMHGWIKDIIICSGCFFTLSQAAHVVLPPGSPSGAARLVDSVFER